MNPLPRRLAALAVLALACAGCVENVDNAPAIAVGDGFYGQFKPAHGAVKLARFFAPEFPKQEPEWPRLLGGLEQAYGPVTSAQLQSWHMAAMDDAPCFLLDYAVVRPRLQSSERLFVCRVVKQPPDWRIVGHVLQRLDTKQVISGGKIPTEACVGTNCPAPIPSG
jgi:hypothetical protein